MGCLGSKEEVPVGKPQAPISPALVQNVQPAKQESPPPAVQPQPAGAVPDNPVSGGPPVHALPALPAVATPSPPTPTPAALPVEGLKHQDASGNFSTPVSSEHGPIAALEFTLSIDKPTSSLVRTATSVNVPPEDILKDVQHLTWLGQGAYGAVYQGIWHGAYVAVKFIPSDTVDPESASFREAQLSTLLAHPNVVQAFWTRCCLLSEAFIAQSIADDRNSSSGRSPMRPEFVSGEGFGDPYGNDKGKQVFMMRDVLQQLNCKAGQYLTVIAMEYCDKGSLHQVIYKSVFKATDKWSDRIALRALIRSAREIAQGVWHLHNSGVIHGDLKPGNVLLKSSRSDRRGFVCKVSDFGLARETFGQSDIRASRWATINYMAPEHFEGLLSKASDVYSFAVVLWEMYTAERPYRDYTQGQVMMGVRTGELRPTWPEAAPKPLVQLAMACMDQDPTLRPTFETVMQQLTNIEGDMRMEEYSKRNAVAKAASGTELAAGMSSPSFSTPPTGSSQGLAVLAGGGGAVPASPVGGVPASIQENGAAAAAVVGAEQVVVDVVAS